MNRLLLSLTLACLAFGALAGCIGYAPDAVHPGDRVEVRYDAYDLATGEALAVANTTILSLGTESPLGYDVERALVGHRVNETVTVESRGDAGRTMSQVVMAPAELGRFPLPQQQVGTVAAYKRAVGQDPVTGDTFQFDQQGSTATVLSVSGGNFTFRTTPPEDQPHPDFGLLVHFARDGDEGVATLVPMDQRPAFTLQTPSGPFAAAGTYQVTGASGGNVTFAYSPLTNGKLLGRDLRLVVTVLSPPEHAPASHPTGNYGARQGQYLGPQAATVSPSPPQ